MGEYVKRSKYISRDAAISKIRDQGVLGGDYDAYEREEDVVDMLNSIPAADVMEVRHGRWEQVEILHVEDLNEEDKNCIVIASIFCPECKRYHNEVYLYGSPTEMVRYCSNCGSKMDGGQHDVVEVVRCADCKYDERCMFQDFVRDERVEPYDKTVFFCADGKRKDGGQDDV